MPAFDPKSGSFTGAGQGASFSPVIDTGNRAAGASFNLSVWGTFSGTVRLLRSFDKGATWLPVTYIDGSPIQWTAPFSTTVPEPEPDVLYALEALAGLTGTANWRLSQ